MANIDLFRAAQHTVKPPMPHQQAAWNWLQEHLSDEVLGEFAVMYRAGPPPVLPQQQDGVLLKVPYYSQNDNASGTGYRECCSSSCAMLAAFWGKVNGDDAYNVIRARYGDTTNPTAQVKALQNLGLEASYLTRFSVTDLEKELNAGRPVAVGWLHYGTPSSPRGGGHWSVAVGYTNNAIIIHDPNGEANLVNGGYLSNKGGKGIAYSRKNWLPRWLVEGPQSGWVITARPVSAAQA